MSNTGQIKRYDPTMDGDCRFQTHGEFVKYDDHLNIVNDLEIRIAGQLKLLQVAGKRIEHLESLLPDEE